MASIEAQELYFQHYVAAPHYAVVVRSWLDENFSGRWIGRREPFD